MSIKTVITAAVAALAISTGAALAQGTAPAAPATAKPAVPVKKATKAAKPRTAESLKCSAEADAKGLKGAERKKFRAKCKKDATAAKPKAS